MAVVVAEFLNIMGLSSVPSTMEELIPYLLAVVIAVFMVAATFGLIGKLAELLLTGWRRM